VIALRAAEQRRLRKRCRAEGALCLTYDDGPGPETTPELLDLLEERSARATFFLLGRRAEAAPEIVERLIAEGHETACHTHNHLNAWKVTPARAVRDVEHGYQSLSRWLSDRPLFRPPYGKLTPWTRAAARRYESPIAWWTIDSGDTSAALPASEVLEKRIKQAGGGVVLMHDFDREGDSRDSRRAFVLETTARAFDVADATGLRVVTMGELMNTESRATA
jgi:peptidoglycan-N-acetylglucosamine deacetylase